MLQKHVVEGKYFVYGNNNEWVFGPFVSMWFKWKWYGVDQEMSDRYKSLLSEYQKDVTSLKTWKDVVGVREGQLFFLELSQNDVVDCIDSKTIQL